MESVRRNLLANPREKANWVSVLLFWWTLGIFKVDAKKNLALEDMFQPLKFEQFLY